MIISAFYPDIDHLLTNNVSVQLHGKGAKYALENRDVDKKLEENV